MRQRAYLQKKNRDVPKKLTRGDIAAPMKSMTGEYYLFSSIKTSFFEYCTADGQLCYFLPANEHLYTKIIEVDDSYTQLYAIAANEYNLAPRYGKSFYEEFPKKNSGAARNARHKNDCVGHSLFRPDGA